MERSPPDHPPDIHPAAQITTRLRNGRELQVGTLE